MSDPVILQRGAAADPERQLLGDEEAGEPIKEATYAPKQDCFWLLIINLIHSGSETTLSTLLKLVNSLVAYFTNMFLQVAVTSLLLLGAERLEQPVQAATFVQNHNMTLVQAAVELNKAADAHSNETLGHAFTRDHGILGRCVPQLGVRYLSVYSIIMFAWFLTMLPEFKVVVSDVRALASTKTMQSPAAGAQYQRLQPRAQDLDSEPDLADEATPWQRAVRALVCMATREAPASSAQDLDAEQRLLIEVTPCQRAVLMLSVPVMRGAVATMVTYSGAKFLILQTSMLTMVMKSLCMKFVVSMDDTIYHALVSSAVRKDISLTRLVTHRAASKTQLRQLWDEGLEGITLFALGVAFVCVLTQVVFGGLMEFRAACWNYHHAFPGALHESTIGFDKLFSPFA